MQVYQYVICLSDRQYCCSPTHIQCICCSLTDAFWGMESDTLYSLFFPVVDVYSGAGG